MGITLQQKIALGVSGVVLLLITAVKIVVAYNERLAHVIVLILTPLSINWVMKNGYNTIGIGPKPPQLDLTMKSGEGERLRFVCISDTHNRHNDLRLPKGDVLLHAGDISIDGTEEEIEDFNTWIGKQPFKHKLVIAGNHDFVLEKKNDKKNDNDGKNTNTNNNNNNSNNSSSSSSRTQHTEEHKQTGQDEEGRSELRRRGAADQTKAERARELLSNCTYLHGQTVNIQGVQIYGTPESPRFLDMAFNKDRGSDIKAVWDDILDNIDVLVTHTPPHGIKDSTVFGAHVGCKDLLRALAKRIRPKFHVFGHIHEDYGVALTQKTVFINASSCDLFRRASHAPIVFDVPVAKN